MSVGNRTLAAIVVVVVFAGGVMTGVALDRFRGEDVETRVRLAGRVPAELERLGISSEQRDRISRILASSGPLTDSTMQDVMARLRSVTSSVDAQIRSVLTEQQRVEFDRHRDQRSMLIVRKRGNRVDSLKCQDNARGC